MIQSSSGFKHDLRTLLVIIVIMGGLIVGLWYLENTQGFFSHLAQTFLTL